MNKKAQGLSLNIVIIAAIAIIVLVIMIVIFGGRIKLFGKGVAACEGTCSATKEGCGSDKAPVPSKNCDHDGDGTPNVEGDGFCCMPVG
jgi:hypothetical protein